jgi:hypothetical protein
VGHSRHLAFSRAAIPHRQIGVGDNGVAGQERGGGDVTCDRVSGLGTNRLGMDQMKKTVLLAAILVTVSLATGVGPVAAKPNHGYQQSHYGNQQARYAHQNLHRAALNTRYAYRDVRGAPGSAGNVADHSHITCDMVRSYVAQVGLQQARAMAVAAGMTPSEERQARQCLASKD